MSARLMMALGVLLLAVPASGAASFDCGKAASAFERAVCADPELSRLDGVLAKAYATALGGLSTPAAEIVQASQHKWLDYAERVCTPHAEPLTGDYDPDGISCLGGTIRNRLTQLEASRMQSGFRFYPLTHFLVVADPEATDDSFNKVSDNVFSTIKIDGDDEVATAFNAMIDKDMLTYGEMFGPDGEVRLSEGGASSDISVTVSVREVRSRRISLQGVVSWYGHGAAHPNYGVGYLHFLIAERRALVASDIFGDGDWQVHLGALVLDELQRTIEGGVWEEAVKDIPLWAADPSRWNFSDAGLIVQFQPYEVAAYAFGAPTVTIPWDMLAGDLAGYAMELATY